MSDDTDFLPEPGDSWNLPMPDETQVQSPDGSATTAGPPPAPALGHLPQFGAVAPPAGMPADSFGNFVPPSPRGVVWPWILGAVVVLGGVAAGGVYLARQLHMIGKKPDRAQDAEPKKNNLAKETPKGKDPDPPAKKPADADKKPQPKEDTKAAAARRFQKGTDALQQGKLDEALTHLKESIRLDPSNARAYYYRGRILTVRLAYDPALADLSEALRLKSKYAEAYQARALVHLLKKNAAGAVADASAALGLRDTLAQAYLIRGRAYFSQGKDDPAYGDYGHALALLKHAPDLTEPAFAGDFADLAQLYHDTDQYDKALNTAVAALQRDPGCPSAHLCRAEAYNRKGLRNQAHQAQALALRTLATGTAAAQVARARMALALEKYDEATRACDQATALDSGAWEAFEVRARAALARGDRAGSRSDFDRAAQLHRAACARDLLERSDLFAGAGAYDRALECANQALTLAPDLAAAYRQRGDVYRKQNDPGKARADYQQALRVGKVHCAEDAVVRAWLHNQLGEYPKAVAEGTEARHRGLQSREVLVELAYAHSMGGDPIKALAYFADALRLDPRAADVLYYRGNFYSKQKAYDKAVADYTAAVAANPRHVAAYLARCEANLKQKKLDEALKDTEEALRRDPTSARACRLRGYLFHRQKDYDRAIEFYTKAIQNEPNVASTYRLRARAYASRGNEEAAAADRKKAEALQARKP
jgi:tetratricopeptide (TPR) repeat protein